MKKINAEYLLKKLVSLDEKLVNIWLSEDLETAEDDIWDVFVVLLETRVELLKTCKDAGIKLSREQVLPGWLERLVSRKNELKLRDIRNQSRELERRKKVLKYDAGKKQHADDDSDDSWI